MPEFCLRVLDIETTGFLHEQDETIRNDPRLGLVELGWTDVLVNVGADNVIKGVEVADTFGTILCKPPFGIPPEASAIHHLLDRDVEAFLPADKGTIMLLANSPPWRGPEKPMALVAHNAAFEREWLDKYLPPETKWICSMKVAARLFQDWPSMSNQALKYRLGLDLPEALCHPPHRAGPDSFVTAHVLAQMIPRTSVRQMVTWTKEPRLMLRCPIGEHRNKEWSEVPAGFLQWAISKPIDDLDCIHWMKIELERRAQLQRNPDLAATDY
jgi:exodeoxyribonuclease X